MTFGPDKERGETFQDYVKKALWNDRIAIDFYKSREFQLREGEGPSGIECKRDGKWRETGNFYIEVESRGTPSGIYRDEDTWLWAIGDERDFFLVAVSVLTACHKSGKYREATCEHEGDTPTRGFLLPSKIMQRVCSRRYRDGWSIPRCDLGQGVVSHV